MSAPKLTNTIKQLIAARGAPLQPGSPAGASASPEQARRQLLTVLDKLQSSSNCKTQRAALLTLATGTFFSINSPASLRTLWSWSGRTAEDAELMREAGLKSISFIGIAKVINNLAVLNECFEKEDDSRLKAKLKTRSRRDMWSESVKPTFSRGRQLWDSIYTPHHNKLVAKLGSYHPDLPVHILESHYSLLLSDPTDESNPHPGPLGRVLTSVLAVACLQGQQGVGSQVTSHIFGLMKAGQENVQAAALKAEGLDQADKDWLCSHEGAQWVLEAIESLRAVVVSGGEAKTRRESKL